MGVISDTSPSLRLTLKNSGLSDYFESTTCSAFAGCMKPDPRIYRQALSAMGARAEESLYVDDYEPESDGARNRHDRVSYRPPFRRAFGRSMEHSLAFGNDRMV